MHASSQELAQASPQVLPNASPIPSASPKATRRSRTTITMIITKGMIPQKINNRIFFLLFGLSFLKAILSHKNQRNNNDKLLKQK